MIWIGEELVSIKSFFFKDLQDMKVLEFYKNAHN